MMRILQERASITLLQKGGKDGNKGGNKANANKGGGSKAGGGGGGGKKGFDFFDF